MKIWLNWDCEELNRGERGSLSKVKYEIDLKKQEVELLELNSENKLKFEEILRLADKIKKLKSNE